MFILSSVASAENSANTAVQKAEKQYTENDVSPTLQLLVVFFLKLNIRNYYVDFFDSIAGHSLKF